MKKIEVKPEPENDIKVETIMESEPVGNKIQDKTAPISSKKLVNTPVKKYINEEELKIKKQLKNFMKNLISVNKPKKQNY